MTVPLSPDEMLRSVQAEIGPDEMLASVQDEGGSLLGAVRQGLGGWGQGTMALLRAAVGTARRSGVLHNVPTLVESWPEQRLREQERRIEEAIGEPQGIAETGARIVGRMVPDAAAIAATGAGMGAALPALGALRGAAGVIARNAAAAPFDLVVGTGAPDQSGIQGLADLTGNETLRRVAESPAMPLAEAALGTAAGSILEGAFRGVGRLRRPRVAQALEAAAETPRPRMTPEEMRAVEDVVEQAPTPDELVRDMAEGRALQQAAETVPVPERPAMPETVMAEPLSGGYDFSVVPPRRIEDRNLTTLVPRLVEHGMSPEDAVTEARRILAERTRRVGAAEIEAGVPHDQAAVQEGLFGERALVGSEQTALLPETAGVPTARLRETKIQPEETARLAAERPSTALPGEAPMELPLPRKLPRDMAKWTDDELVARFVEIDERIGRSGEQFNEGYRPWTRFDDDIAEQRSGTVLTNAAGRSIAAINRDAEIMSRLAAEAERRGVDLLARADEFRLDVATREARAAGEGGFAVPALMRSIAGAGLGATAGAAIDQENPLEGAVVGGLAGAGALAAAPRLFRGTPKRIPRTAMQATESTRGLRAGIAEGTAATPARVEPTPAPATVTVTPEDAARYATYGGGEARGTGHTVLGFAVDDVAANTRYTQLLRESVEDLRARGLDPKTREPWSEIQGSTVRDLGVPASEVAGDIRNWDRATFETARRWYRTGEARVKAITEQLASGRQGTAALADDARATLTDELSRVMGEMRTLTSQMTRARSAFGRNLNFLKSVTRNLDDPFSWRIVAERVAGRDLTADELVGLDAAIRTSRHDAQTFVARLRPTPWQEKVSTFLKAMWLTVPATHVRNPLSTATHMGARTAADALVGEWVDRLASAYSGVRSKSLAGRFEGMSRRVAREAWQNTKNAMRGMDAAKAEAMDIPHLTNFGDGPFGRFVQTITDGVFRALGAEDAYLYTYAYRGAAAEQLTLIGRKAGKRGSELTDWVRTAMHNPPADVASTAQEIALQAVFRDETGLARFITSGKASLAREHPNAKLIAEIVMPYVRTPASVLHKTLQFTPFGMATGAAKGRAWVQAIRSGDERAILRFQREMVDGIARGTFGTAAMLGLGYTLYRQGAMTAGRPSSPADRAQWELEGKQPYSVRFRDRWYRLTYMAPIGTVMAIGAAVAEANEQAAAGETAKASRALSGASQTLLDVPMLTGTKALLEATTDIGGSGERYLQNQAASAVPGVVGALARTVDPTVRQPTGPGEAFMSRVPGLSQNVQPRLDVFGRPLRRDENVLIRAGRELFDPFRSTASRVEGDPVTEELARIGAGVAPVRPRKGEETQDFRSRQVEAGGAVYAALQRALASTAYRTVLRDNEQRREFVDAVVRATRADDPFNALETAWRVRRRVEREARQQ